MDRGQLNERLMEPTNDGKEEELIEVSHRIQSLQTNNQTTGEQRGDKCQGIIMRTQVWS